MASSKRPLLGVCLLLSLVLSPAVGTTSTAAETTQQHASTTAPAETTVQSTSVTTAARDPTWITEELPGVTWILHQAVVPKGSSTVPVDQAGVGQTVLTFTPVAVLEDTLQLGANLTVHRTQHFRFQYDIETLEWRIVGVAAAGPVKPATPAPANGEKTRTLERELGRIFRRGTRVQLTGGILEISGKQGAAQFVRVSDIDSDSSSTPTPTTHQTAQSLVRSVPPKELLSQLERELGINATGPQFRRMVEDLHVDLKFVPDTTTPEALHNATVKVSGLKSVSPASPKFKAHLEFGLPAQEGDDAKKHDDLVMRSYKADFKLVAVENGEVTFDVLDVKPGLRGNNNKTAATSQSEAVSTAVEDVRRMMADLHQVVVNDLTAAGGPSVKLVLKPDKGHSATYFLRVHATKS